MDKYTLDSIISIYKSDSFDYYIEKSDIIFKNRKRHITNTRPLSAEMLSKIASLTNHTVHKTSSLLPKDIIYLSYDTELLSISKRDAIKSNFELLNKCKGELLYPPMFFILRKNKLQVYCYKRYKGLQTRLFYNPFPNNIGDSICMGNIKITSVDYIKKIHEYIESYYSSIFAEHGTIKMKDVPYGKEIEIYKKAISGKCNLIDYLIPLSKNSKQIILNDIIKNQNG